MNIICLEPIVQSDIKIIQDFNIVPKPLSTPYNKSLLKSLETISDDYKKINYELFTHDILNISLNDFIVYDSNKHLMIECDELPFIFSFIKDQTLSNIKEDFQYFKDELNYKINFDKLLKHIKLLKQFCNEILNKKPNVIISHLWGKNVFFNIIISYYIKEKNKKIKVIFFENKPPQYFKIFKYAYNSLINFNIIDNIYWGYHENLIRALCEGSELEQIEQKYIFTHEDWRSNTLKISNFEIKYRFFSTMHNIQCIYKCPFCLNPKNNFIKFIPDEDNLNEMIDYMIWVYDKYNLHVIRMFSPLPFLNNHFYYFFNKLLELNRTDIKISLYSTPLQVYNNLEILNQFNKLTIFPGIEHFSERLLNIMNKQTTRKINQSLMFNKTDFKICCFLLYDFMPESLEEFKDLLNHFMLIKRNSKHVTVDLIKMYFSSNEKSFAEDEHKYNINYIIPHKLKEYFKIEDFDFFLTYENKQNLLHQKNKLLRSKNEFF